MPIFVSLSEHERKEFFNKLKLKINCSWENFYPKYNLSRSMFFNYLSGKYGLPKNLFLIWKKLIGDIKIFFVEKEKQRYLPKIISKVKMDEDLSEILGVLNGDGHLSNFNYEVCVVGNLKKLFEKKFGISFTLRREKSAFKLRCYSKEISNFLSSEYNLPRGNKLGKLKMPNQVLKSNIFLRNYIKGLYDTYGSFYLRR